MAIRRKKYMENTPFPKIYPHKWDHWCKDIARRCRRMNKNVDQNWWANYQGIKGGPNKNPYMPKRF